jgi:EAL and modified HD-GYP domain-containing signal transduction protein
MPWQDVAVITQPVLDARGRPLGQEVLFGGEVAPAGVDSSINAQGTAALLLSVFGGLGLDDLTDSGPAWLSIAKEFLLEFDHPPVRPDRVVLQLKGVPCEGELPDRLARLVRMGYTLALDGWEGGSDPLLELCSVVKVDVRARPLDELSALVAAAQAASAQAVACGIGAEDTLERCRELGFHGFQGSGVAAPRLVRRRLAGVCSEASLEALAALTADPEADADIEELITTDPGLALTLLRYVAAAYAAPPGLGSVREAVDLLGSRLLRRWATMVAHAAPAHPREELGALALRRGRACEAASNAVSAAERESYFTVGLLSVAGDLAGADLNTVVASLPLAPDVRTALLAKAGPKGERLATVLRHEQAPAVPA